MSKIVFRTYAPNQLQLLLPGWNEQIAANYLVRLVNSIAGSLALRKLYDNYEGGDISGYYHGMLWKAIIFACFNYTYSNCKTEEAKKVNIYIIELCGMNETDHNMINCSEVRK